MCFFFSLKIYQSSQNGDVKSSKQKKQTQSAEKNKKQEKPAKKVETVIAPKPSTKAKQAEKNALKKQELKEYKESEVDGGDWTTIVPKGKRKTDESGVIINDNATTPNYNETKGKKKDKKEKNDSNSKEIKNRVNNELKNEENLKTAIEEIQGKLHL